MLKLNRSQKIGLVLISLIFIYSLSFILFPYQWDMERVNQYKIYYIFYVIFRYLILSSVWIILFKDNIRINIVTKLFLVLVVLFITGFFGFHPS